MPLGLRTVIYPAPDLAGAKAWYASALGVEPYFDPPLYIGVAVGGFEPGLIPDARPGATAYWGVAAAATKYKRLIERGGTPRAPPADVGGGITVATLLDPDGNLFGIIENPHVDPSAVR
jgi:predicted enzyme related to lactoylglutathione lyase